MAITVKDVALKAGVSTATVSRVLNNDPGIKPQTRKKVKTAILDTGYRMNKAARSLKTSRTGTIGLLVPELVNDFFMTVAQGVEDELHNSGYGMIICNANENRRDEEDRINLLIEQCVDGVIIIPASSEGRHFNKLRRAGIPVVMVDRLVEGFEADAVLADNVNGAYSAVAHLISSGCRRFGFIGGSLELSNFSERFEGFKRALTDYNIPVEEPIIKFGDVHVESGYDLMEELMNQDNPPQNIFIANYFLHVGATKYLLNNRETASSEIRIAGFDDMALSSILGFSSVTVSQPMREMGRRAAALLLRRINTKTPAPCQLIRLKTSLVTH
ncbi:MAG: LacI family DNA-binding transcriptional regulator [Spirochaetales bacterium]|nr:LacI family DNA-binding transcriptional regulator [Spirochaetales bacterium]